MISQLRGKLIEKKPPVLLIEVACAFAYDVHVSMHTFYQLPDLDQDVMLYTQFIVREDGHYLYGFYDQQERTVFQQLLKVNGIGPKVALGILSRITATELIDCVAQHNITALQQIPGIGKKTAERLVIEMRDRLRDLIHRETRDTAGDRAAVVANVRQYQHDAIAALLALGYKNQEASRAVLQIPSQDLSVEMLIRTALKNMDKN